MARNFWNSFYKGWDAGTKIDQQMQDAARRRDIRNASQIEQEEITQYDPEQLAKLRDPALDQGGTWDEQAQAYRMPTGGLQAPVGTPTWENGAYQTATGERIEPTKKYRLGGQVSSTPFSQDAIDELRATRIASVYDKYGDPEKANLLKSQAQQMKLGKLQYENAAMQAEQAKNVNALMKLHQKRATMTPEEFMNELVNITDPMNKDGMTHGFKDLGDGTFEVTRMINNRIVGSQVVTPEQAFLGAFMYASPEMFKTMTAQNNWQQSFNRQGEQWDKSFNRQGEQFDAEQSLRVALANQAEDIAVTKMDQEAAFRNAQLAMMGRHYDSIDSAKNRMTPVGTTDDGKGLVVMTPSGQVDVRPLPPNTGGLFRKFTGDTPPKTLTPKEANEIFSEVRTELMGDKNFKKLKPEAQKLRLQEEFNARLGAITGQDVPQVDYGTVSEEIEKNGVTAPTSQGKGLGRTTAEAPTPTQTPLQFYADKPTNYLEGELRRLSQLRGQYAKPEELAVVAKLLSARKAAEQYKNNPTMPLTAR